MIRKARRPTGICCMVRKLKQAFSVNLEGWDGEGGGGDSGWGGIYAYLRLMHAEV